MVYNVPITPLICQIGLKSPETNNMSKTSEYVIFSYQTLKTMKSPETKHNIQIKHKLNSTNNAVQRSNTLKSPETKHNMSKYSEYVIFSYQTLKTMKSPETKHNIQIKHKLNSTNNAVRS